MFGMNMNMDTDVTNIVYMKYMEDVDRLDSFSRMINAGYTVEQASVETGYQPTERELRNMMEVHKLW